MDKKDRIIVESVLYLTVNTILLFIMFFMSIFLMWDMDHEMIFRIKATSVERLSWLCFVWSSLAVLNGACVLWTIRFNKYFCIFSLALTIVCVLNRLAIYTVIG